MRAWLHRWFAPRSAAPAAAVRRSVPAPQIATTTANAVRGKVHDRVVAAPLQGPVEVAARAPALTPSASPAAAPDADGAAPSAPVDTTCDLVFFASLLGAAGDLQLAPGTREQQLVQALDRLADDTSAHASLLPRSAAVVPQLLARLRGPTTSLASLSEQVSRDLTLVAEVVRMANSAYYRRPEAVVELEHAIQVLGVNGMQSAIARAVLKPLIDVRSGAIAKAGAPRLWQHTDHKAQLCAALARDAGLDPFEAYLTGLVHDAVWSVVMRTMDAASPASAWGLDAPFVHALGVRRDHLFSAIARKWKLSDALSQVASEVAQTGLAAAASPQGRLLFVADHLASRLCAAGGAGASGSDSDSDRRAGGAAAPLLATLGASARDCYRALAAPAAPVAAAAA